MTNNPVPRIGFPERCAALKRLAKASTTFDDSDTVHTEVRDRMLERLKFFRLAPRRVLDLGSATGKGTIELAALYPEAQIIAAELSHPMAAQTQKRCVDLNFTHTVVGNAEQLPFLENSIDLVFANLLLPWCDPQAMFGEISRVLCDGGLALFTTVGPDTLQEVRKAWAAVDEKVHVHGFVDMHDLGDLAARAGLIEPVMDIDRLRVDYGKFEQLVADLRACGATNVAFGRRVQLTGPRRWRAFCERLEAYRSKGTLSISVELIFGQAWGMTRSAVTDDGAVKVSVDELTRSLRRGDGESSANGIR
ncbi:MAG: class I SAM-dependent methyltransferase [Pseudomonadota bacterium]|nr:class I SAM-dependent methyltransferase [Pseudomonadota bacterium]